MRSMRFLPCCKDARVPILHDPICLAACAAYGANRWLLKPFFAMGTFMRGHFNLNPAEPEPKDDRGMVAGELTPMLRYGHALDVPLGGSNRTPNGTEAAAAKRLAAKK